MLTTVCLLVGPIYLAVYPGNNICETRNTVTMILLILYFIMMWPFQYCIYLYYKQLANSSQFEENFEFQEIEIDINDDLIDSKFKEDSIQTTLVQLLDGFITRIVGISGTLFGVNSYQTASGVGNKIFLDQQYNISVATSFFRAKTVANQETDLSNLK